MRKVIYSEYVEKKGDIGGTVWEKEAKGEAVFHQFGCEGYECEHGAFSSSTAIIELEDGTVKNVPVENIRFISGDL